MIDKFEESLRGRKLRESTIKAYRKELEFVEKFLKKKLDKETSKADIQKYLTSINKLTSKTIRNRLIVLKLYFKWLYGIKPKGKYPKIVDFPFPKRENNNITPEDLLTEEEILKMINVCDNFRDKAIISLLFDSAIRRGELLGLNIGHVRINGGIGVIEVGKTEDFGKSGCRSVPISKSIPYLRDWINSHPTKEKEEFWEDIKDEKTGKIIGKGCPLFIALNCYFGKRLHHESIRQLVKRTSERAKINKRVFPHLFRHSRLTQLDKRGISPQAMKYFAGWTRESNMPSVYSHWSASDTQEAIFQADGVIERKEDSKILEPVKCSQCGSLQNPSNILCSICNSPLSEESRKELEAKREFMQLITSPDVWKFLQSKIKKKGE